MKKFLKFIRYGHFNTDDEVENSVYSIESSITGTQVVLISAVILEAYFFLLSLTGGATFLDDRLRYRICYLALLLCASFSLILVGYAKKNLSERYKIIEVVYNICTVFLLAWALCITYFDRQKYGAVSAILIMTFMMTVPAFLYIHPGHLLAYFLATDAAMFIFYAGTKETDPMARANMMNYGVFCIISLIAGEAILYTRYSYLQKSRQQVIMAERARSANEAKVAYISNLSHEIRTPLNAILGMNEMIMSEEISPAAMTYCADIDSAGREMKRLINDMLDFTRLEAGRFSIENHPYSIGKMAESIHDIVCVLAEEKKLKFHMILDDDLPRRLVGDENLIKRVVLNLASNAVKYTNAGSVTIRFSKLMEDTNPQSDRITLRVDVIDTGIGIQKENTKDLFEAFTRIRNGENHIEGSGLGLAICKSFVELMDGTIAINSVYGEGSTFYFEIPQCIAPLTDSHSTVLTGEGVVGNLDLSGRRILVVDDFPVNTKLMELMLKDTGAVIQIADNGERALEIIKEQELDLVLMDYRMPGMDGVTAVSMIRTMEKTMTLPVIAVSGDTEHVQFVEEGFTDVLNKPFTMEELYNMMKKYL